MSVPACCLHKNCHEMNFMVNPGFMVNHRFEKGHLQSAVTN